VSSTQAAHDHVEPVGKLRTEGALAARAQHTQDQVRQRGAAEHCNQRGLDEIAPPKQPNRERERTATAYDGEKLAEPQGEARLQDQAV